MTCKTQTELAETIIQNQGGSLLPAMNLDLKTPPNEILLSPKKIKYFQRDGNFQEKRIQELLEGVLLVFLPEHTLPSPEDRDLIMDMAFNELWENSSIKDLQRAELAAPDEEEQRKRVTQKLEPYYQKIVAKLALTNPPAQVSPLLAYIRENVIDAIDAEDDFEGDSVWETYFTPEGILLEEITSDFQTMIANQPTAERQLCLTNQQKITDLVEIFVSGILNSVSNQTLWEHKFADKNGLPQKKNIVRLQQQLEKIYLQELKNFLNQKPSP